MALALPPAPPWPSAVALRAPPLGRGRPLLLHASRLALAVAQVIELGPPHRGALDDLDLLDRPGVEREDALDPVAEGHLAHGHRGARAGAAQPDHDALEDLHALALSL